MRLRCGGIINECSLLRLPLSPLVKEFLKSVNIWQSILLFFFDSQGSRHNLTAHVSKLNYNLGYKTQRQFKG